MSSIKKILCAGLAVIMIMAMSAPAFAANGAKDGTGPTPIHQRLKDGTGCGKTTTGGGGGVRGGGGIKDGSGPLRDGSGGNANCPYLP